MVDALINAEQISNPELKKVTITNIKSELMEILFDYSSIFQMKYEKAKETIREKLLKEDINIDDHKEFIDDNLIPFYAKLSTMYENYEEMFEELNEQTKINPYIIGGIKIGVSISFGGLYYHFSTKDIESYDEFENYLLNDIVIKSDSVIELKERENKYFSIDEQQQIAREYFCYFSQFI